MRVQSDVLRQIAGSELEKLYPASEPRARNDLITSVVRQWQTCAGHAGVFTVAVTYWLVLVTQPPAPAASRPRASRFPRTRSWRDERDEQEPLQPVGAGQSGRDFSLALVT